MTRTQQLPKDLQRYFKELQRDPVRFAKDILGIEPWDKQQEILYSVRDNRKTTVRSCNAAGKTTTAAMTMLWYLSVHPQQCGYNYCAYLASGAAHLVGGGSQTLHLC